MELHLQKTHKKAQHLNDLIGSSYLLAITVIYQHASKLIERGADWSLIFLPISTFIKAALYWHKTQTPGYNDSKLKTNLNKAYYSCRVLASGAGVGLALAGLVTFGFGVLIVSGFVTVVRSLGKAIRSAREGDKQKVVNNLLKSILGTLISGGFTLMTFYPPWALVGATMAVMATAYIVLSSVPTMLAEAIVSPVALQKDDASEPLLHGGGTAHVLRYTPVPSEDGFSEKQKGAPSRSRSRSI